MEFVEQDEIKHFVRKPNAKKKKKTKPKIKKMKYENE